MLADLLEYVTVICVFHHDTKMAIKNKKAYQRELLGSSKKACLYDTTFLCLMEARILTSFRAFSFSRSERLSIFTFFKAYSTPSSILLTLYTQLYDPSPSHA